MSENIKRQCANHPGCEVELDPSMSVVAHHKPHKGRIAAWTFVSHTKGIGFFVAGRFLDHERFADQHGFTSYVVKAERMYDDTIEIETRNSRYTLVRE